MRKSGVALAAMIVLFLAGCASSGGSSTGSIDSTTVGGDVTVVPYIVNLNTLTVVDLEGSPIGGTVKNPTPFSRTYDDLMMLFPPFPADMNWADYQRVTITVICYDEDGNEIEPADGNAMVSFIYDITGDIRGPDMGPGPNTPLKEMNIGGYSGTVNTERGARSGLTKAPQAILFQNSRNSVKYIEVTEITFHNR